MRLATELEYWSITLRKATFRRSTANKRCSNVARDNYSTVQYRNVGTLCWVLGLGNELYSMEFSVFHLWSGCIKLLQYTFIPFLYPGWRKETAHEETLQFWSWTRKTVHNSFSFPPGHWKEVVHASSHSQSKVAIHMMPKAANMGQRAPGWRNNWANEAKLR